MILFLVLIVILLIGLTAAAVMGWIGGFLADATSSRSFAGVPTGDLSSEEIAHLHFDQALRGYRMDEVDEVLDTLTLRLRELETEVAALSFTGQSQPAHGDPGDPGHSGRGPREP